jgi:hypothetical protein
VQANASVACLNDIPTPTRCCQCPNIAADSLANTLPPTPCKHQQALAEQRKGRKCCCPPPNFALCKLQCKPSKASFAAPTIFALGCERAAQAGGHYPPPQRITNTDYTKCEGYLKRQHEFQERDKFVIDGKEIIKPFVNVHDKGF